MIVKPGYKTTELLVTVLTAVGALVAALAGELPPRYASIASAISVGAYALSRGLTKFGAYLGAAKATPGVVASTVTPQGATPPAGNVEGS